MALGSLILAIAPLQVAYSQRKLNQSVDAFRAGDCRASIHHSLQSAKAIGVRPEPFQMLSFCDARLGRNRLALRMAEQAVALEPDNWEFHYSLAIAQAVAGDDPRSAARESLRLNPRSTLARDLVRAFSGNSRRTWNRRARNTPLPFQQ